MTSKIDNDNMNRLLLLLEKQAEERPVSRIINNPMTYVGGLAVLVMVVLSMGIFIYNTGQNATMKRLDVNEKSLKDTLDLLKELQTSQLVLNATVKQNYEITSKNTNTVEQLKSEAVRPEEIEKIWKELDKREIFMDEVKDYMRSKNHD